MQRFIFPMPKRFPQDCTKAVLQPNRPFITHPIHVHSLKLFTELRHPDGAFPGKERDKLGWRKIINTEVILQATPSGDIILPQEQQKLLIWGCTRPEAWFAWKL